MLVVQILRLEVKKRSVIDCYNYFQFELFVAHLQDIKVWYYTFLNPTWVITMDV